MRRFFLPLAVFTGLLVAVGSMYIGYELLIKNSESAKAEQALIEAKMEFTEIGKRLEAHYTQMGEYPEAIFALSELTTEQLSIDVSPYSYEYRASRGSRTSKTDQLCRYTLILEEGSYFGDSDANRYEISADKCND